MLSLSRGPTKNARSYQGYFINGYRFHTKQSQIKRRTQNSGVVVKGDEVSGERDFFGVLKEVLELEYDAPYNGGMEPKVVFCLGVIGTTCIVMAKESKGTKMALLVSR